MLFVNISRVFFSLNKITLHNDFNDGASVFYEVANFRKKYILTNLSIIFAVRSPVELPEVKKVAENVPNDVSHKPTMSGANRTQQVIVRNSSSIELQVSVPGIN